MLSRALTEIGIYPAVDPLTSTSRILDRRYIADDHYDTAVRVKQILQRNKELQDINRMGSVPRLDGSSGDSEKKHSRSKNDSALANMVWGEQKRGS